MSRTLKTTLCLASVLLTARSCLAAGITGKWIGHFHIEFSTNKNAPDPKMQAAINKQMGKQAYHLTLKPNRTFIATSKGPGGLMRRSGTWLQKGSVLTLKVRDRSGREELAFGSTFIVDEAHQTIKSKANYGQVLTFTRD